MPFVPYHYRSIVKIDQAPIDQKLAEVEKSFNKKIAELANNPDQNKENYLQSEIGT